MRRYLIVGLLALGFSAFGLSAHASSTLRVGSQVLVAGDSIERAEELLGRPSSKPHHRASNARRGRRRGGVSVLNPVSEQWHFRHDGRFTTITVVDGRIVDIEERRS